MNASNRNERNGPPLSVTIVTIGMISPVSTSTWHRSTSGCPNMASKSASASSTASIASCWFAGRRDVERVLVLGPVVPAAGQPPGAAGGGLELGEVQLPDLVRPGRLVGERGLAAFGQPATFPLVLGGQEQSLVAQQPQHRGLGHDVAVVADHRPDLAVPPRRMRQRMHPGLLKCTGAGRTRPRSLRPVRRPGPWPASDARSARACPSTAQNLVVDMPASTRITSRSPKGPAGPPRTSSTPAARRAPHPEPESDRRPRPPAAGPPVRRHPRGEPRRRRGDDAGHDDHHSRVPCATAAAATRRLFARPSLVVAEYTAGLVA